MDACDIASYRSSCLRALSHTTFDKIRFEYVLDKIKGWAEPLQLNELQNVLNYIQITGRPLHQNVWGLLIVLCGCQAPHLAPALRFLDNDLTESSNCSTVPDLFVIKSDHPFVIVFRRTALAHQGQPVYKSLSILGMSSNLYMFCSHGRWGCSESVCCSFLMWVDCEFDQLFARQPWSRKGKTRNTYEHIMCKVQPLSETEVSSFFILHETTARTHNLAPYARQPRIVPENPKYNHDVVRQRVQKLFTKVTSRDATVPMPHYDLNNYSDRKVAYEIFHPQGCYNVPKKSWEVCEIFNIQLGDFVLDIGGNIGLFCVWSKWQGARGGITCEPCVACHACLKVNAEACNFVVDKHAIGIRTGLLEMIDFGETGAGSSRSCAASLNTYATFTGQSIMTHEVRLEDVISLSSHKINVVKLDAEGADLAILEHCTCFGSVRLLMVEVSTQRCRDWNYGLRWFLRALLNLKSRGFSHAYIHQHMFETTHWTQDAKVRPGRDDTVFFYSGGNDDLQKWRASTRQSQCLLEECIARVQQTLNSA